MQGEPPRGSSPINSSTQPKFLGYADMPVSWARREKSLFESVTTFFASFTFLALRTVQRIFRFN
ncbi:MAG: hypothetical protein CMJ64_11630 [Planctomycetaceae bacterium]|nr:hypothetical protein [Planctomycetaceae bacterium]